jgi:hypothetical protein
LGIGLSPNKIDAGPSVEILGVLVETSGSASITESRRGAIQKDISALLDRRPRPSASLAELQHLAGVLLFVTRIFPLGKAFLRRIFDQVKESLHSRAPSQKRRLRGAAVDELRWWQSALAVWNGTRLLRHPSNSNLVHVWTDACDFGIGGHLAGSGADSFSRWIPEAHRSKDIIFKEALAVLHAVETWQDTHLAGKAVVFHVDNQALVASINSGRCRHRSTQAVIRRIYTLAIEIGPPAESRGFTFTSEWLCSEDNARADVLSRHPPGNPSARATAHDNIDAASSQSGEEGAAGLAAEDDDGDHPVPFDPSDPSVLDSLAVC